ncbi:hypothetical protein P7D22_21445 [Lichenihabitans sp. Uapishka_5]|nr:hypothetical protein [Lichenihabitans sp. Uapishka_5]MDX7953733.1 hypothetical protein [Lichenihabitans sp. Uapishka_5]
MILNKEQLEILAAVVVFFGGVAMWVRHRVHAFDQRFGRTPHLPGE